MKTTIWATPKGPICSGEKSRRDDNQVNTGDVADMIGQSAACAGWPFGMKIKMLVTLLMRPSVPLGFSFTLR